MAETINDVAPTEGQQVPESANVMILGDVFFAYFTPIFNVAGAQIGLSVNKHVTDADIAINSSESGGPVDATLMLKTDGDKLSAGAIVAIVLGVLAVLGAVAALVVWRLKRNSDGKGHEQQLLTTAEAQGSDEHTRVSSGIQAPSAGSSLVGPSD